MKRLKENMTYLGLSWKKEMLMFFILALAFLGVIALLVVLRGLDFIIIFPVMGFLGFTFFYFSRYGQMRRAKMETLNREFVNIFTYFGIYITDGFTVYNALEKVKDYCSEDFLPKMEGLLQGIDEDKSVEPYVKFAAHFEDISVKEVMLSVYQMVDEGAGGVYIRQFQKLFGKLSDTRHAMDAAKRLSRLDTLAFLPLAGSGLAMLSLTMSIMEIMGGLMDVL